MRFEKPETRSQFIDSKIRPIGDKATIAANPPPKCGRPLVSWLHGLSLLPSFVDSRFTSFVVVSWDSAFVWAQVYPEPQIGLEFGVGWISGSRRHPARASGTRRVQIQYILDQDTTIDGVLLTRWQTVEPHSPSSSGERP